MMSAFGVCCGFLAGMVVSLIFGIAMYVNFFRSTSSRQSFFRGLFRSKEARREAIAVLLVLGDDSDWNTSVKYIAGPPP